MNAAQTSKRAASVTFRAADYLQADDLPGYLADITAYGVVDDAFLYASSQ